MRVVLALLSLPVIIVLAESIDPTRLAPWRCRAGVTLLLAQIAHPRRRCAHHRAHRGRARSPRSLRRARHGARPQKCELGSMGWARCARLCSSMSGDSTVKLRSGHQIKMNSQYKKRAERATERWMKDGMNGYGMQRLVLLNGRHVFGDQHGWAGEGRTQRNVEQRKTSL